MNQVPTRMLPASRSWAQGEVGLEGGVVLVRFEGCLCECEPEKLPDNVIDFPVSRQNRPAERNLPNPHIDAQSSYRPVEFDTMVRQAVSDLRWKNGAVWFLKSLSRQPSLQVVILSDYPEIVVRRKISCAAIKADVMGSIVDYDPIAGLYITRACMDEAARDRLVEELKGSHQVEHLVYVGARSDDLSSLERATGIFIGPLSQSAGPGQFSVRNLIEAASVVRTVFERHG